MAAPLHIVWTEKAALLRINEAASVLANGRARQGMRRALNHTGDKTYTIVRRTLAKQMGLSSQKAFDQNRAIRKRLASDASLEYQIVTTGRAIPMKEFNARQLKKGWSAAPWGKRRQFRRAFAVQRWGGNLYQRIGKERFPVEKLLGPNLNKELVKDQTEAAFQMIVSRDLPPRVLHEIMRLINIGR